MVSLPLPILSLALGLKKVAPHGTTLKYPNLLIFTTSAFDESQALAGAQRYYVAGSWDNFETCEEWSQSK